MKTALLAAAAVCLAFPCRAAEGGGAFGDFTGALGEAAPVPALGPGRAHETAAAPGGAVFNMERCAPEAAGETPVYADDFKWGYSLGDIKERDKEIYASGKRLGRRAFWNPKTGRLELPYDSGRGGNVPLPEGFVRAVIGHVEEAFAASYVDALIFPDMGHSHFLIPEKLWEEKFEAYPVSEFNKLYEAMMSEPRLQVLYHTAEQLKTREEDGRLVADPRTQFRYKTRNIVGGNPGPLRVEQNPQSTANTVNGVDGYRWWGGGFNISASKDGCFAASVGGRTVRFDLSLFDLEPSPGSQNGGY